MRETAFTRYLSDKLLDRSSVFSRLECEAALHQLVSPDPLDTPPVGTVLKCLICAFDKPWGIFDTKTGATVCEDCKRKAQPTRATPEAPQVSVNDCRAQTHGKRSVYFCVKPYGHEGPHKWLFEDGDAPTEPAMPTPQVTCPDKRLEAFLNACECTSTNPETCMRRPEPNGICVCKCHGEPTAESGEPSTVGLCGCVITTKYGGHYGEEAYHVLENSKCKYRASAPPSANVAHELWAAWQAIIRLASVNPPIELQERMLEAIAKVEAALPGAAERAK